MEVGWRFSRNSPLNRGCQKRILRLPAHIAILHQSMSAGLSLTPNVMSNKLQSPAIRPTVARQQREAETSIGHRRKECHAQIGFSEHLESLHGLVPSRANTAKVPKHL